MVHLIWQQGSNLQPWQGNVNGVGWGIRKKTEEVLQSNKHECQIIAQHTWSSLFKSFLMISQQSSLVINLISSNLLPISLRNCSNYVLWITLFAFKSPTLSKKYPNLVLYN